jgi:hypothetical protein
MRREIEYRELPSASVIGGGMNDSEPVSSVVAARGPA